MNGGRKFRDGWILAETLMATLVGGAAISSAIFITRTADEIGAGAVVRADAVVLAEKLMETARVASEAGTGDLPAVESGRTVDGRFDWRVERARASPQIWSSPTLTSLQVIVTPVAHVSGRNARATVLSTELVSPSKP